MQTDVSKIVFDGKIVHVPLEVWNELVGFARRHGETGVRAYLEPTKTYRDLPINLDVEDDDT